MDVDEQLEDAFEAAFAEDEAAGLEDALAEQAAEQAEPAPYEHLAPEGDDYDEAAAPTQAEAPQAPERDETMEVFHMLREPARGEAPGAPDASAVPDPAAAYKKEVYASLTEEQKERYSKFMSSTLPRPKMKKLMQSILKNALFNDKAVLAMCGISKLFLGELVEQARMCAAQEGHNGPLLPRHIHRAYQELGSQGKLPRKAGQSTKRVFR